MSHTLEPFVATHRITFTTVSGKTQVWDVLATPEGPAYTEQEWHTASPADWELVNGRWLFQGQAPANGKVTVERLA